MMGMRKRGCTACVAMAALVSVGLWTATSAPAVAGDVSISLRAPGLAIHTGPQGVAVSVGQPGFYGEISVGDLPAPPPVIYARPVIIEGRAVGPPMYLRVPPGYERHWADHCAYYHACARQVYFVQDDWYQHVYVPRYRHAQEFRRDRDEHFRAVAHEREFARDHDRDYHERIGHDRGDDHGLHRGDDHHFSGHDDHGYGDYGHGDHGHDDHGHDDHGH